MTMTTKLEDAPPVTTLQEARTRVFDLVGHAMRPQLWLMLLDPDGQQLSVLIPIDGIPVRPEPGSIQPFAVRINDMLAQEAPGGSIILTLERPGSAALTAPDQAWATELTQSFGKLMRITGLFVAHDDGVAVLTP
ncbi:hypothetical protein [Cryobacterium sp. Y62]|uniref:hypothetical protein n=1 Tax=Cryobacterium sp. Y62 TaxID=2048284 RepID=UPI000CE519C3|nr:hypothetical protein [Cryobacterium sp. Y62]